MRNAQTTILSAADTATQTGSAIDTGQCFSASFQAIFGDVTAVGVVKIQYSNDNPAVSGYRNSFTPTNWTDIPSATMTVTAGVSTGLLIPVMSFSYIRAIYTRTSGGSTTVTVNMNISSV